MSYELGVKDYNPLPITHYLLPITSTYLLVTPIQPGNSEIFY